MSVQQENFRTNSLLVSEIFLSIQGEGPNVGSPSIFLRLAICNLHCWYCDTKYSWMFNEKLLKRVQEEMEKIEVDEMRSDMKVYDQNQEVKQLSIVDTNRQIIRSSCSHLVITGGEPLIQQAALVQLLETLKVERKFFVEIETNGTIIPCKKLINLVNQWNVSPKLTSAGNGSYASEKSQCFEAFKKTNSYFKFVIQSENDLADFEVMVEKYGIPQDKVILMPEANDVNLLKERSKKLFAFCEERGYNFSTRLHILLYGNARGK
jgi:7-carboxy-7-deazaguanine synthase